MEKIFQIISDLEPSYKQFWIDLCMMETRSDDVPALNRQADVLQAYAEEHGLSVKRTSHEGSGDMLVLTLPEYCGEAEPGCCEEEDPGCCEAEDQGCCGTETPGHCAPVAVLGHMDTVHEKGAFGTPPVTEKDGLLYGPGVGDMKGGVVTGLLAVEAIRRAGVPHREIRVILNPDEESGEHMGMELRRSFHEDNARGCIAAFNCETGCPGQMTVGRKGVLRMSIDVTGITAHAGNAYFEGASAIREMAHKIVAIEAHSTQEGMTFNCGKIEGGTVVNIIPAACHAEFDIRFCNAAQRAEAERIVREETARAYVPGTTAVTEVLHELPAMEDTAANRALFDKVAAFAAEYGLEELRPIVRGGGSDSAFTTGIGVPTVCSMGVIGYYPHTTRECAEVDSLGRRAKILAGALLSV